MYEPRYKRAKQSLYLGQYNTLQEAVIVRNIVGFYYSNSRFGCLNFVDGRYFTVQWDPPEDCYVISQLAERVEGKEKADLVPKKVMETYQEFLQKQSEWRLWRTIVMGGSEEEVLRGDDDAVHAEEHGNSHLEVRAFDLMNMDQVHNSEVLDDIMLDDIDLTSVISSDQLGDTPEPSLFDATNPLPLSDLHDMLAFSGEDSGRTTLPEPNCEVRQSNVVPFSSGFTFNANNQVESLLLQLVNVLQREKQELQQNNLDLQARLSELENEFREHMSCCSTSENDLGDGGYL